MYNCVMCYICPYLHWEVTVLVNKMLLLINDILLNKRGIINDNQYFTIPSLILGIEVWRICATSNTICIDFRLF